MRSKAKTLVLWVAAVAAIAFFVPASPADPLSCAFGEYKPIPGLAAQMAGDTLTLNWDGEGDQQLRLRLGINSGRPTMRELAVRHRGSPWIAAATNATPEFRVVSGLRRITNQQLDPLAGLGVPITQEIIDKYKWEAFWDAPLNVPGGEGAHNNTTPPQRGVLNQPGLPRSPDEIKRASAVYHVTACEVRTNGARLEISFPGVQLGVFAGRLQFTVYKGANLIRQEIIAKTEEPSVAYKYDAGIRGLAIQPGSRLVWKGLTNLWQEYRLGGPPNEGPVVVKSSSRLLAAETAGAALAAFPPPHTFFWARETSYNLGYNWYQKESGSSFSFGIRQAEREESAADENRGSEDRSQNFALLSARPGTWQRMPVYFYVSADSGPAAVEGALLYTRGDRFKALPGYQVMATHFHMGLVARARRAGGLDALLPDLEMMQAAGINIVAPIDGGAGFAPEGIGQTGRLRMAPMDDPKWFQWSRGLGAPAGAEEATGAADGASGSPPARASARSSTARRISGDLGSIDPYKSQADYYEAARRHSDRSFVVMPNTELMRGEVARTLGGHSDILISHPVYWTQGRAPGQPLSEDHPKYGRVYHLGDTADMMEMIRRENMLIFMPHPRSKGSTGFPDAIKDTPHFTDENYRGIGFRWGMGLDGSERRLCEYRCLPLLDDMNNWVADAPTPPKYIQAISEIYQQGYGDDIYANNPVNYVKVDTMPPPGDWSPIINAMKHGDYFVTSGEVLIPFYAVRGSGNRRTIVADVEWTFPLEFVEVVWGDGHSTDRQIISATEFPAFGRHHFEVPFDAAGKKWVRFAAWDSAGNGAMVQPVKLPSAAAPRSAAQ
jgi:hypothetical protein